MSDFSYLNYEPVVYGTVLPMTYVSTVEYSPIRRAYIDALISSLIELNSEPEVTIYINRLRDCRDKEWDNDTLKLVHEAMRVYNNRYIYLNGGGQEGGIGVVDKFLPKITQGFSAAFGKTTPGQPLGRTANFVRSATKGTANLLGLRQQGSKQPLNVGSMVQRGMQNIQQPVRQQQGGAELENALELERERLNAELERLRQQY